MSAHIMESYNYGPNAAISPVGTVSSRVGNSFSEMNKTPQNTENFLRANCESWWEIRNVLPHRGTRTENRH